MTIEAEENSGESEEDIDAEGIEVLKVFIYQIGDLPEFRMAKRSHSISFGPLTEEDLELRLGPGPSSVMNSSDIAVQDDSDTIQKCVGCGSRKKKRQEGMEGEQVKLTCGICLDTMKEESSTKCGHLFCRPCITQAIRLQGKCPTCRTKMSIRSIRRIFVPQVSSSSSNSKSNSN